MHLTVIGMHINTDIISYPVIGYIKFKVEEFKSNDWFPTESLHFLIQLRNILKHILWTKYYN